MHHTNLNHGAAKRSVWQSSLHPGSLFQLTSSNSILLLLLCPTPLKSKKTCMREVPRVSVSASYSLFECPHRSLKCIKVVRSWRANLNPSEFLAAYSVLRRPRNRFNHCSVPYSCRFAFRTYIFKRFFSLFHWTRRTLLFPLQSAYRPHIVSPHFSFRLSTHDKHQKG